MKLLVVDDEMIALRGMVRILKRHYPEAEIISTQNPEQAQLLFDTDVDVAFLDIEMQGMTGLELGAHLMEEKPKLNIIYVTAYSDYALDAYQIHASGYLTKPLDEKKLLREMEHLRYPLEEKQQMLQAKCFGNFEVFCNGVPLHFSRSSSKEVLAYLIDRRGSSVTIDELCSSLWEDAEDLEKKKSYIRTMLKALRKTLEEYDLKEVLICQRNSYAVNTTQIECDYYRFLEHAPKSQKLFQGEYMSQYSWAERTLGNLTDMMWQS